jgi:hypothetical protein
MLMQANDDDDDDDDRSPLEPTPVTKVRRRSL